MQTRETSFSYKFDCFCFSFLMRVTWMEFRMNSGSNLFYGSKRICDPKTNV